MRHQTYHDAGLVVQCEPARYPISAFHLVGGHDASIP